MIETNPGTAPAGQRTNLGLGGIPWEGMSETAPAMHGA